MSQLRCHRRAEAATLLSLPGTSFVSVVPSVRLLLLLPALSLPLGGGARAGDAIAADTDDVRLNCRWAEKTFAGQAAGAAAQGAAQPTAGSRVAIVHEDGAGDTKVGLCAFGTPLRLGERTYTRGIGVNSRSVLRITLERPAAKFLAEIGLDRNVDRTPASATMHVSVEGKEVFATPVLRPDGAVQSIEVKLGGARSLDLIVGDGGDGRGWDQADWADARVLLQDGTVLWLDDLARDASLDGGLPFSFVYGGKPSPELIGAWERSVEEKACEGPGGGRRLRTLTLTDPETRLEVRAECTIYTDTPGADWTLHFTNKGGGDAPALEQIQAVDLDIQPGIGAAVVLHRLEGSTCARDDWRPLDDSLPPGRRIEFGAASGRSSAESPFFNLDWGTGGAIVAVGWSGQWRGSVERSAGGDLRVRAGMERLHLELEPGESIRSPRILVLHWSGNDPLRGHNLFRRTMLRHVVPRIDDRTITPPIAHLSTSFYEMNSSTEANVLSHLEAIRGLGFEMFWLDAYWTRDGFPAGMGHYGFPIERAEPRDRFPRGLSPIAEAAHEAGMGYLMWFEPERVHPGTALAREHPGWVISPAGDGSGLFNLGIPEAREYMTRYLSTAVKEYKLDCLRIDYNIDPLPFWEFLDKQDPDRVGMGEIRYVEGLYKMWDKILLANPSLFIDNCASGGRRIDLETCSRSIPLWRSDNTCDMVDLRPATILDAALKNQLMSAGLNRYLPFSVVGQMGAAPYFFRSGFNGGISFAEDCRPAGYPRDQLREAIAEGKRLRKYWFGDFYPLSDVNLDPAGWCVLQYHRPAERDGMIVAFRRHRSHYASYDCEPRGIDPAAEYYVTESPSYRPLEPVRRKGEALRRFRLQVDEMPGSLVVEYKQVAP